MTDVPGTTRDTIDARVTLGGVLLRLTDTAGLRDTADPVEAIGVHRALDAAADAALAIAVFDAARPLDDDDRQVIAAVQASVRIAVLNKADLPAAVQPDALAASFDTVCVLSAKERTGLEALEQAVAEHFPAPDAPAGEILTNARHAEAIGRALESLRAAREAMLLGVTPDAVLTEAEEAMAAIGELTGASIREDITNRIFARRPHRRARTTPNLLDGSAISFEDFYTKIRSGKLATTSAANVGQFQDAMRPILAAGKRHRLHQLLQRPVHHLPERVHRRQRYAARSSPMPTSMWWTPCPPLWARGLLLYLTVQQEAPRASPLRSWCSGWRTTSSTSTTGSPWTT